MLVKFSVIRTINSKNSSLYVCGSLPELGQWIPTKAVPLEPSNSLSPPNEPSFWEGTVELDSPSPFDYKFICLKSGVVEWEGCGDVHNRHCEFDEEDAANVIEGEYWLAPARWIEQSGVTNEFQHTTAFYFKVICDHNGIHFSKMTDQIWLGSCPRQFYHIAMLRSIGVTAVMTLQTSNDLTQNSIGVFPPAHRYDEPLVDHLSALYSDNGIVFVWLPTDDMSSAGRIRMVPQGVLLLQALIANGHKVYVHCNAGVGRSTAVVAAYLNYVQDMPLRKVEYFIASKRPAVFFDRKAMQVALTDFRNKFGNVSDVLKTSCT